MGRRGHALTSVPAAADAAQRAERAAAAERAVLDRHLRRLWGLPGTALGVNSHPSGPLHRAFLAWNYWWQAHLLDCLVDAELRAPSARRRGVIGRVVRGIHVRNLGRWTNAYYDDMAWLGLALERAERRLGLGRPAVVALLAGRLLDAWSAELGGGIPWRRGDEFKNAPANGPAAILLARTGFLDRSGATVDWIDLRLRDPSTGLIRDGARPDGRSIRVETPIYTYNQGVVLGAETELARRSVAPQRHVARVVRLVDAVGDRLAVDGVLTGHAGGDSGLFTGIAARYLALVARTLPDTAPDPPDPAPGHPPDVARRARERAAALVRTSADAAWAHAARSGGGVVFGPDWSRPARIPAPGAPHHPERDLSVQLSGWLLLEAAARLDPPRTGARVAENAR